MGWALTPPRQRLRGTHPPETPDGAVALNGWVVIGADGVVTIVSPKAEMGQGITTALAMLVAEELDCRWEDVRVAPSPIDRIYGNIAVVVDGLPFHPDADGPFVRSMRWLTAKTMRELGVMMTGGRRASVTAGRSRVRRGPPLASRSSRRRRRAPVSRSPSAGRRRAASPPGTGALGSGSWPPTRPRVGRVV